MLCHHAANGRQPVSTVTQLRAQPASARAAAHGPADTVGQCPPWGGARLCPACPPLGDPSDRMGWLWGLVWHLHSLHGTSDPEEVAGRGGRSPGHTEPSPPASTVYTVPAHCASCSDSERASSVLKDAQQASGRAEAPVQIRLPPSPSAFSFFQKTGPSTVPTGGPGQGCSCLAPEVPPIDPAAGSPLYGTRKLGRQIS